MKWVFINLYSFVFRCVLTLDQFLIPGVVVPLVATVGINNKVVFLEKYGSGNENSTGAYELDPRLIGQGPWQNAWRSASRASIFVLPLIHICCCCSVARQDGRFLLSGGGTSRQGRKTSQSRRVERYIRACRETLYAYRFSWETFNFRLGGRCDIGETSGSFSFNLIHHLFFENVLSVLVGTRPHSSRRMEVSCWWAGKNPTVDLLRPIWRFYLVSLAVILLLTLIGWHLQIPTICTLSFLYFRLNTFSLVSFHRIFVSQSC